MQYCQIIAIILLSATAGCQSRHRCCCTPCQHCCNTRPAAVPSVNDDQQTIPEGNAFDDVFYHRGSQKLQDKHAADLEIPKRSSSADQTGKAALKVMPASAQIPAPRDIDIVANDQNSMAPEELSLYGNARRIDSVLISTGVGHDNMNELRFKP